MELLKGKRPWKENSQIVNHSIMTKLLRKLKIKATLRKAIKMTIDLIFNFDLKGIIVVMQEYNR
jgi:hypothetical protein